MPVGKTRDAGWEVGVSRTVPVPLEEAWDRIADPEDWLGEEATDVRSHRPLDRVRVGWRGTIVQVVVRPAKTGTTVSFHQERLGGPEERERRRAHWAGVLDRLFPERRPPGRSPSA